MKKFLDTPKQNTTFHFYAADRNNYVFSMKTFIELELCAPVCYL